MPKKNTASFFIVLLVILLLIVMALTLVLGLYKMGRYPVLNTMVDTVISRYFKPPQKKEIENVSAPLIQPITVASGSILQRKPLFAGVCDEPYTLLPFTRSITDYGLQIEISSDYKTITVTGMLQKFDPLFDGKDESVSSWSVHTEYPVVSRPCIFQDCIVFVDASQSLYVVNILNGSQMQTLYLPFFPGEQALSVNDSLRSLSGSEGSDVFYPQYIVEGRNGKMYCIVFKNSELHQITENKRILNSSCFLPDQSAVENMASVIQNWAGLSEKPVLQLPLIMGDDYAPLPVSLNDTIFVAFLLPSAGTYTAGLSDENGIFIQEKAVVCIFKNSGELASVSVDYQADRPNVTFHFEKNTMYYALASALYGAAADETYFSIKKVK